MRGATQFVEQWQALFIVSIHAPHAGRDSMVTSCAPCPGGFNPRAPCGARPRPMIAYHKLWFQSTRPMRGATISIIHPELTLNVSIHAPHAGRDLVKPHAHAFVRVSIHAPHAGRDKSKAHQYHINEHGFNPRAPCGARLLAAHRRIHQLTCFNPRAPCGARPP